MASILIAEDDETIRAGLVALLETEFHDVVEAADGEAAFSKYTQALPDLMILDIMMPRKSGLEICREIRQTDQATRILILSARNSEVDKVLGLEMGADDYLAKPFGSSEFLARIRALLRRPQTKQELETSLRPNSFRLGKMIVREDELLLRTRRGGEIPLTLREFKILRILSSEPMKIVSKEKLTVLLWGYNYQSTSRTLDQHVYNLRKKLRGSGVMIDSVYRAGFRLSFS